MRPGKPNSAMRADLVGGFPASVRAMIARSIRQYSPDRWRKPRPASVTPCNRPSLVTNAVRSHAV